MTDNQRLYLRVCMWVVVDLLILAGFTLAWLLADLALALTCAIAVSVTTIPMLLDVSRLNTLNGERKEERERSGQ